ncbi:MAG: hypothetical protein WC833_08795 [Bacteroidales bacterium]|jgi:hypothetical protein
MDSLIIKAAQSPRIRVADNVTDSLQNIIARIHLLRGQEATAFDINFMSCEFANELKTNFDYLTISEVNIALTNGVKGEYGKYYGLNVITFLDWIKSYVSSPERQQAIKTLQIKQITQKTEPTADEIEKIKKENLRNAWLSREQGYSYALVGTYEYLKSKGLIQVVDKIELRAEAQKRVEKKLKSKKIVDIINSVQAELNIINEAKTILAERFLDSLSHEDLNNIIK